MLTGKDAQWFIGNRIIPIKYLLFQRFSGQPKRYAARLHGLLHQAQLVSGQPHGSLPQSHIHATSLDAHRKRGPLGEVNEGKDPLPEIKTNGIRKE